jgi:hypothetical protein
MLPLSAAASVWPRSATVKALRDRSGQVTAVGCSQLMTASPEIHRGDRVPVDAAETKVLQQ